MEIRNIYIPENVKEKIEKKHKVFPPEVDQVIWNENFFSWIRKSSKVRNRYVVYGKTFGGRYLKIVIKPMGKGLWELRTALEMKNGERKAYREYLKKRGIKHG